MRRAVAGVSSVLLLMPLATTSVLATSADAAVAPASAIGQGFTITPSDLAFILKQIKISERHAITRSAGNPCGTLVAQPNDNIPDAEQLPDPLTPYGLRTVDGSCNNLTALLNRNFGAADQVFPRLTTPSFRNAEDITPAFPVGPLGSTSYAQTVTGNVVIDSQPRLISNLVDDQTTGNPAAVAAAAAAVGGTKVDGRSLVVPNVNPDVGLSPPYNSMLTFFGQFFDHGVDQTVKSGGTVFIPLKADDPLRTVGPDGIAGTDCGTPQAAHCDEVPANQAFMVLTRARNQPGPDGVLGTADDEQNASNTDSPWVDQSQTYTSHPSHQVFIREYVLNSDNHPVSTGKLLTGLPNGDTYNNSPDGRGGLSTWAAVKKQAHDLFGIELVDRDVSNIPLMATDPYGTFIPGPARGLPQFVTKGPDGKANTADDQMVEGNRNNPVPVPADAIYFDTPFVGDIAHNADPSERDTNNDGIPDTFPTPDPDNTPSADFAAQPAGTYDDEMLNAHFACGDGRCNENIALSAIHQVFHSEHDRVVDQIKQVLVDDADPTTGTATGAAALGDWTLDPGLGAGQVQRPGDNRTWNGERIFQAARFITEMEYQHLVFEEFARKIAPTIPAFTAYRPDIDPAIHAEFAQAVYRFGHSMLREKVDRTNEDPTTGASVDNSLPLLTAFLNPPEYFDDGDNDPSTSYTPAQAAGALIRGSSDQVGNDIDEFVTETLRNNLLGLPLDLPAINMARARETGIPTLNAVRREMSEATGNGALTPYTSWMEFGKALKHEESLVNFVAAYGTHPTIRDSGPDGVLGTPDDVTTAAAKRAAAQALFDLANGHVPAPDAFDFMNSTSTDATGGGKWDARHGIPTSGLESVDLWVGGLAEAPGGQFAGLLGTTFNAVFEQQLTDLQDGDRFYYLNRTPGMNLLSQLEGNSFSEIIARNTDGAHSLAADPFTTADCRFELGTLTFTGVTVDNDPNTACNESTLLQRAPDGTIQYKTNNNPTAVDKQAVYNGSDAVDRVLGGKDSDTTWGSGGDDVLDGGGGDDVTMGGIGADTITDVDGNDILRGGPGDDAINGGPQTDLLLGGDGADLLNGGTSGDQSFGGPGNDFVIAGQGIDAAQGDGGDDWIQGGASADLLHGDFAAPFLDDPGQTTPGNDVFVGQAGDNNYVAEGGDDVMSAASGVDRYAGSGGFDWAIHQYDGAGVVVDDDMTVNNNQVGTPLVPNRDVWQETEGVSGAAGNDTIRGDDVRPRDNTGAGVSGCDALDETGAARVAGLRDLLPTNLPSDSAPLAAKSLAGRCPLSGQVWGEGNILLGGTGSDTLEGRGGDDIIDGDRSLSVHISVRDAANHANEIGTTDLLEHQPTSGTFGPGTEATGNTPAMTLQQAVFAGLVHPDQLVTVRTVDTPAAGQTAGDIDTAVFEDIRANYDCITNGVTTSPCDTTSTGAETTVVHARGSGADGTDTIRNIERLEFSNGVPPDAPTITGVVAGDRNATVSWAAPSGTVTGFRVEVVLLGTTTTVVRRVEVAAAARGLTVAALTNGQTYQFRVWSLKNKLTSNTFVESAPVTPTSTPVVTPPPPPTSVPPLQPALLSSLSAAQVSVHGQARLRGSVAPFQGVTVTLQHLGANGAFATAASTTFPASATDGRYSFRLPTTAAGRSTYRVVVSGPGIVTTTGPTLGLAVVSARVTSVTPTRREFVTVRNNGPIPLQLAGWRLRDSSRKSLALPRFTLAPGASVQIVTGSGHSTAHRLFLGRRTDMWEARHDTVRLLDGTGTLVSRLRY